MSWRNSRLSIWRPLASSVAMAAGLIFISLTPGLANAAPPTREPNTQSSPIPLGSPCGFPVVLDIDTNKEILTTFTRSGVISVHTTGTLKVHLTTDTGETIDRNISGPIFTTENSDGSITQKTTGLTLWVFDPEVAPDLPRLVITHGKTESVFSSDGDFTFISQQGSYEDICAALAS
jgi:hypothetical protein